MKTNNTFQAMKQNLLVLLNILLLTNIIHVSGVSSSDLCIVTLEPKNIYSAKNHTKNSAIKCESKLPKDLQSKGAQFFNPVFDLSFGDKPRTGIFILRGNNSECNARRDSCWSEFEIKIASFAHLFRNEDTIAVTCKVADRLTHVHNNIGDARCDNKVTLHLKKVLRFGQSCLPSLSSSLEEVCGKNMVCRRIRGKLSDYEYKCVCAEHYASVRLSSQLIICVIGVKINQQCNYTEQCALIDAKTICKVNSVNGNRMCDCDDSAYFQNERNVCDALFKRVPMLEAEPEIKDMKRVSDKSETNSGVSLKCLKSWINYFSIYFVVYAFNKCMIK